MDRFFVNVLADINCEWQGLNPVYRLYVNDEMFAERTWIWTDSYLEELVQIYAEPGEYQLRWELVKPCLARIQVSNFRVQYGPGQIVRNGILRINHES
jgi:hypothetical protein